MNPTMEETINLTDLSFTRFCCERYGINRGIYNTIDSWFFNQGFRNILERRKKILSFLEFVQNKHTLNRSSRCKFGNGGLTIKLQEYFYSQT